MKLVRVALLGGAMAASAITGILAVGVKKNNSVDENSVPQPMEQILIAAKSLSPGEELHEALKWADWPKSAVHQGYITRAINPDALDSYQSRKIKARLYAGDPVRREHFQHAVNGGMADALTAGKRAVAVKIAADTSAGGFILPNDYADVIMSRRRDDSRGAKREVGSVPSQPLHITETILRNVKVLAIDQTTQEDEQGRKVLIGQTATLELTPSQAEIMTVAQQMAERLTLSLRASADKDEKVGDSGEHLVFSPSTDNTIRIVSGGAVTEIGVSKN